MGEYVAFLRAINLGKNRKFPMAELRSCLEAAGFETARRREVTLREAATLTAVQRVAEAHTTRGLYP